VYNPDALPIILDSESKRKRTVPDKFDPVKTKKPQVPPAHILQGKPEGTRSSNLLKEFGMIQMNPRDRQEDPRDALLKWKHVDGCPRLSFVTLQKTRCLQKLTNTQTQTECWIMTLYQRRKRSSG
jgi:hypothetical protein